MESRFFATPAKPPGEGGGKVKLGARARSPQPQCAICLDLVQDRGVLDGCRHPFCYDCIRQWSLVTNLCPLCKGKFNSIRCHSLGRRSRIHGSVTIVDDREQRTDTAGDFQVAGALAEVHDIGSYDSDSAVGDDDYYSEFEGDVDDPALLQLRASQNSRTYGYDPRDGFVVSDDVIDSPTAPPAGSPQTSLSYEGDASSVESGGSGEEEEDEEEEEEEDSVELAQLREETSRVTEAFKARMQRKQAAAARDREARRARRASASPAPSPSSSSASAVRKGRRRLRAAPEDDDEEEEEEEEEEPKRRRRRQRSSTRGDAKPRRRRLRPSAQSDDEEEEVSVPTPRSRSRRRLIPNDSESEDGGEGEAEGEAAPRRDWRQMMAGPSMGGNVPVL